MGADWNVGAKARLSVAGAIEYRDKDGNIIKVVPFNGSLPVIKPEEEDTDGIVS